MGPKEYLLINKFITFLFIALPRYLILKKLEVKLGSLITIFEHVLKTQKTILWGNPFTPPRRPRVHFASLTGSQWVPLDVLGQFCVICERDKEETQRENINIQTTRSRNKSSGIPHPLNLFKPFFRGFTFIKIIIADLFSYKRC